MRAPPLRILLALIAISWLGPSPGAIGSEPDTQFLDDTRDYLRRLEKLGLAGVVLVARDGKPVLAEGYGLADRERGIRWSPGTVSTIGSITKQFTGAAILLLEEEGRLAVDDPITKYFAGVPNDKRTITLHHLLTHSSGIVDLDDAGDWDPIGREELVRRALAQPLAFPPGEEYDYSNAGYSLLGAVIEQLTGGSYERFVRDRLFVPAGMYETGYVLPAWGEGRLAQGYRQGERWGTVLERPLAEDGPYWVLRANGGIHATAYDMLRWAQALTAGRVLSPESLARYWTPHVSEGGDTYYGYGWVIAAAPGDARLITHNGGNGILFADMAIVPEARLVVFMQTNVYSEIPMVTRLLEQIGARLFAGEPYPQMPDVTEAEAGELAALAGDYALPDGAGTLRVAVDGGALAVEPEGRRAFTLLLSTRPVDPARAERLSRRMDEIVTAYLGGDLKPLWEAYRREAPIERLRDRWSERRRVWEEEHGALTGHQVLGTALVNGRDSTVVRLLFERGAVDRTYVWDPEAEERLLGISRRGLDPLLRVFPVAGAFASWDNRTGASRPLAFERDAEGRLRLRLGEGQRAFEAEKIR